MSIQADIRNLLEDWPFDPEDNIRIIKAGDGREILQVRLPLGVEQYELDGRPDGAQPYGWESALDFQLDRLEQARLEGVEAQFELDSEICSELIQEGILFYYRYLHLFQMNDWHRTRRDTGRNIRLFDFIHQFGARKEDRMYLEKWRPYILRIHSFSTALIQWEDDHHDEALEIVLDSVEEIQSLPEAEEETFEFERERSIQALQQLATQIRESRPLSERERLEKDLQRAIADQEFERAAELRDRIQDLEPDLE